MNTKEANLPLVVNEATIWHMLLSYIGISVIYWSERLICQIEGKSGVETSVLLTFSILWLAGVEDQLSDSVNFLMITDFISNNF